MPAPTYCAGLTKAIRGGDGPVTGPTIVWKEQRGEKRGSVLDCGSPLPRTTHTVVLDAATGKTVADIPGQKRNHGVAIAASAGRGFITDGEDGSVTVFDSKTYAVLGKVKAAEDADGVIFDPASGKVLVVCGDAGVLIPISSDLDVRAGKADAAVVLGGKPEFLAADDRGRAYVNLVDEDQVAVVDTKTMKVVNKWPTSPGGSPVGMSMDGWMLE